MRKDCETVVEIYDSFDAARDELNKKIRKSRIDFYQKLGIAFFSAVLGAVLTLIVGCLAK